MKNQEEKEVAFIDPLCSAVTMTSHAPPPVTLTPTWRGLQYFRDEDEMNQGQRMPNDSKIVNTGKGDPMHGAH